MTGAAWARDVAASLLERELPRRWRHTAAVAGRAADLQPILGVAAGTVEAAAWLHDVGYAPGLALSGFHPLDGARYLQQQDLGELVVRLLVAHHSCAVIEAGARGLAEALVEEFPLSGERDQFLLAALTYCDMTTGPAGERVGLDERLREAQDRYGAGDVVSRSLERARPLLREQCELIEAALARE